MSCLTLSPALMLSWVKLCIIACTSLVQQPFSCGGWAVAMAVPGRCKMRAERTCVKSGGVSGGVAQIVGALAYNRPLPRRVRARACIHRAPGRHSVAPRVGAGPIEGEVLLGALGGVRPVLLAGTGCKHKALSGAPLSNRTASIGRVVAMACAGPVERLSCNAFLIAAGALLLAHASCTVGVLRHCICNLQRSGLRFSAGGKACTCGSRWCTPPCPIPSCSTRGELCQETQCNALAHPRATS